MIMIMDVLTIIFFHAIVEAMMTEILKLTPCVVPAKAKAKVIYEMIKCTNRQYNTRCYIYNNATSIPYFILGLTKIENTLCKWASDVYGSYDNLNDAISACTDDLNCGKIYNAGCSNEGTFELCKTNAETTQATKGSCIYELPPRGKHHYLSVFMIFGSGY